MMPWLRLRSRLRLPMPWAARGACWRAAPLHQAPWPQTVAVRSRSVRLTQFCQRRDSEQAVPLERSRHGMSAWRWPQKDDADGAGDCVYFSSLASGLTPARSDRGAASQPGGGARRPGLTRSAWILSAAAAPCLSPAWVRLGVLGRAALSWVACPGWSAPLSRPGLSWLASAGGRAAGVGLGWSRLGLGLGLGGTLHSSLPGGVDTCVPGGASCLFVTQHVPYEDL